jgi:hypothetical protein
MGRKAQGGEQSIRRDRTGADQYIDPKLLESMFDYEFDATFLEGHTAETQTQRGASPGANQLTMFDSPSHTVFGGSTASVSKDWSPNLTEVKHPAQSRQTTPAR